MKLNAKRTTLKSMLSKNKEGSGLLKQIDELEIAKRVVEIRECSFMNYEEALEFAKAEYGVEDNG